MTLTKVLTAVVFVSAAVAAAGSAQAARKSTQAQTLGEAMHSARIERGYVCYTDHYHYGSGSGSSKKAAQASAISSWSSFVDLEYGSAWASFGKAGSKKISCTQGSSWECSVEARPCRS